MPTTFQPSRPTRSHHRTTTTAAGLLAIAFLLGGCANRPQPLYQWETYQSQVYEYLKGSSSDPQKQIAALEQDYQKIQAQNRKPPPGFHAHLGLLYAAIGKDDAALQAFQTEKALFPESTAFVDRLLAQASGRKEKAL
ncbi:DUF4810 domain-containing protein [Xylophilus sp. Kf1]|nr:DUF4810 domain-containing protein [Xylophilus sp. Kf1]